MLAQAIRGAVVVSNAGVGWSGSFASMSEREIDSLLDLNLRGRPPGPGRAGLPAAGLGSLADALRTEIRSVGIGVTMVTPGVVATPNFERRNSPYQRRHPRPVSPQIVATAIADAVENAREDIVVPGWQSFPARLKVSFPALYRLLESRFA
ncbi:MAG TPA: hypothetical protein VIJ82_14660 [Streptosporangiaceae bacterium]|jgi:short-subunit dehydrogenase